MIPIPPGVLRWGQDESLFLSLAIQKAVPPMSVFTYLKVFV